MDKKPNRLFEYWRPSALIGWTRELFHPDPSDKYSMQFTRSIVVSVISLVINIGGYYALKQIIHVHYLIAAPIGYCLGVVVNFYLSTKWVFATRKLTSKHVEFFAFLTINLIGLGFYELLIAGMVEVVKVSSLVVPIIATTIVFFWNFLARKKFLY